MARGRMHFDTGIWKFISPFLRATLPWAALRQRGTSLTAQAAALGSVLGKRKYIWHLGPNLKNISFYGHVCLGSSAPPAPLVLPPEPDAAAGYGKEKHLGWGIITAWWAAERQIYTHKIKIKSMELPRLELPLRRFWWNSLNPLPQ